MMDFDATQAINLSDFEDDNQEDGDKKSTPVGYLKVLSNRGFEEKVFPVYVGENFIGRGESNEIAVPVKSLSKQHACIEIQADAHHIYDMGSRNKTRKGKLFLKPNIRYNIQHDDKFLLADMSCQYFFGNQYKTKDETISGSDTDSELMLDGVDSDPAMLIPPMDPQKESENSENLDLSDCIQPTQAVNNVTPPKNKTLSIKTPAAPRAGGILAAESDEENTDKNDGVDVSVVGDSGSDTDVDVDAYADDTADFTVADDDMAMAATQACNFLEPPTQPVKKAKATLSYDASSSSESDDDMVGGKSLFEAATQAYTDVPGSDDEKEEDEARGRSLFEAETQAFGGADDGEDDEGGRDTSIFEEATQAAPAAVSDSEEEDDDAKGRSLLFDAATQAVDTSDTENENKKRVSIASTVLLDESGEFSPKKSRASMSPTKIAMMKSTKQTPGRNESVLSFVFEEPSYKKNLKDLELADDDTDDTDLDQSTGFDATPFEKSTDETLPHDDMDFIAPTQAIEECEDLSTTKQYTAVEEEHSITDEGKAEDAALVDGKESDSRVADGVSDEGKITSMVIPKGVQHSNEVDNEVAVVKRGVDHRTGDRNDHKENISETKEELNESEGETQPLSLEENTTNEDAMEPTVKYDLHRSQSDKSKDSNESSLDNVGRATSPTLPYLLEKDSTKDSKGDPMETLVQPIEADQETETVATVECTTGVKEGEKDIIEDIGETQVYGADEVETEEAKEGLSGETGMELPTEVDATQPYGVGDDGNAEAIVREDKTENGGAAAMETEPTQAYGTDDNNLETTVKEKPINEKTELVTMDTDNGAVAMETDETQAYRTDDVNFKTTVKEKLNNERTELVTMATENVGDVAMEINEALAYGTNGNLADAVKEKPQNENNEPVTMETEETQAYGTDEVDDGTVETQAYGVDQGDTQVPDSQEADQVIPYFGTEKPKDNVFADDVELEENQVVIDAAPQRRKSGDEGILKKRKSLQNLNELDKPEKGGLLSALKKKVRFGRKSSGSQSGSSGKSSRSSSRSSLRSSHSSTESGEGEECSDENGNVTFEDLVEDLPGVENEPEKESGSSRKRKLATVVGPSKEEVKKLKGEKNNEVSANRRKRKTATVEKPNVELLSTPEKKGLRSCGSEETDSPSRRSRRVDENVVGEAAKDGQKGTRNIRSKVTSSEDGVKETGNVDAEIVLSRGRKRGRKAVEKEVEKQEVSPSGVVQTQVKEPKGKLGKRGSKKAGEQGSSEETMEEEMTNKRERSTRNKKGKKEQTESGTKQGRSTRSTRGSKEEDVQGLTTDLLSDKSNKEETESEVANRGRSTRNKRESKREEEASKPVVGKRTRGKVEEERSESCRGVKRDRSKDSLNEGILEEENSTRTSRQGNRDMGKETELHTENQWGEESMVDEECKVGGGAMGRKSRGKKQVKVENLEVVPKTTRGKKTKLESPSDDVEEKKGQVEDVKGTPTSTRGRKKNQEADDRVTSTPVSTRGTRRRRSITQLDDSVLKTTSKRGQKKADDDQDSNSSTLSLETSSVPEENEATFAEPKPVRGTRGRRGKTPAVKEASLVGTGSQESEKPSTPKRGKGKMANVSNTDTLHVTSTPTSTSKASKRTGPRSVSKSPRRSPITLEVGSSPSLRRRSSELRPKVMFTGVIDKSGEKIALALGGVLVDSVFECTHLVTDKVRRTVKFLCCLSRGALIVTPEWLEQSKAQQKFVDANEYILTDKDAEKQHKFKLLQSHEKAKEGTLLSGWKVHATPGVKPDPSQMKDIIKSAGGEILSRVPCQKQERTVVISCEDDTTKCLPAVVADIPIVSAEFILTGLLRQEIDIESFRLAMTANRSPSSTPAKKTSSKSRRR